GAAGAGVNLSRSSGRRFAYLQFSSREVGSPLAASAAMAARRRPALADSAVCAGSSVACSSTMRVVRAVVMASGGLAGEPVIAAPFELERERAIAAAGDPPAHQHVHEVRHDVLEQPLIVRDQHAGALRP